MINNAEVMVAYSRALTLLVGCEEFIRETERRRRVSLPFFQGGQAPGEGVAARTHGFGDEYVLNRLDGGEEVGAVRLRSLVDRHQLGGWRCKYLERSRP